MIKQFLNKLPQKRRTSTGSSNCDCIPFPLAACSNHFFRLTICLLLVMTCILQSSQAGTFFFPHFADGNGLQTTFVLSNLSDEVTEGTLTFYDSDGDTQMVEIVGRPPAHTLDIQLSGKGTKVLTTSGKAISGVSGYAKVEFAHPEATGVAIFNYLDGREASILPGEPSHSVTLFAETSYSGFDSGIAVFRTQEEPILLKLHSSAGILLAQKQWDFHGHHAAQFIHELFPTVANNEGILVMESDSPIVATGLRFSKSVLSTIPAYKKGDLNEVLFRVFGLNFSPYVGGLDPTKGDRVTDQLIRELLRIIAPYTNWVRTFGSTLGLENVGRIAKEMGLSVAGGAWLSSDTTSNAKEIHNLITEAKKGHIDIAIVGSETLLRRDLSVAQLLNYIQQVQQELPGIPVTTAETYYELLQHPEIVDACDIVFANYYPAWEGISVINAVAAIAGWHAQVQAAAGGQPVFVSETGWPSGGSLQGDAVPSPENAGFFFKNFVSWARATNTPFFYFEAFDEDWKSDHEGSVGDKWGCWDRWKNLKPEMKAVFAGETVPDNWSIGSPPGDPENAEILFTYVPPYGSYADLRGAVRNVNPADYAVAVYIQVSGRYWTKPYWTRPTTTIQADGSWVCDITTGGIDQKATLIVAYLIPKSYDPPLMRGTSKLPVELDENAVGKVEVTRQP